MDHMATNGSIDFGYPWWLSYGHLVILLPALGGLFAGWRLGWRRLWRIVLGGIALWAATSIYVTRSFNVNGIASLPTESFLKSGTGRVLDIGAGTGRSSIMVLTARPKVTLVAMDLFGDSFGHHFGSNRDPRERLLANLKAAGVADRAVIETGDMRKLPFAAESFDAIVSAYAVDHVGRDGALQALAEAHRVVKPGGQFLLVLVGNDRWTRFAYGPLLTHGGTRGPGWWREAARQAGFAAEEEGSSPATIFFLLRRPA